MTGITAFHGRPDKPFWLMRKDLVASLTADKQVKGVGKDDIRVARDTPGGVAGVALGGAGWSSQVKRALDALWLRIKTLVDIAFERLGFHPAAGVAVFAHAAGVTHQTTVLVFVQFMGGSLPFSGVVGGKPVKARGVAH